MTQKEKQKLRQIYAEYAYSLAMMAGTIGLLFWIPFIRHEFLPAVWRTVLAVEEQILGKEEKDHHVIEDQTGMVPVASFELPLSVPPDIPEEPVAIEEEEQEEKLRSSAPVKAQLIDPFQEDLTQDNGGGDGEETGENEGLNTNSVQEVPEAQRPSDLDQWGLTHRFGLSIPKLSLRTPVYMPTREYWDSRQWELLEEQMQVGLLHGAAAYPHSVSPGRTGNLIIAGHSSPPNSRAADSANGHLFSRLPELEVGDTVQVDSATYEITNKTVVTPAQTEILAQQSDESVLKLITCYPVGTTQNRMVLSAVKVEGDLDQE